MDNGFIPHAADGLAILLWSADPGVPTRLATPFFHAAAASAMNISVEIYFSAGSVELLRRGVAETLRASARHPMTILDHMRQAAQHGALFLACSDALAAHGIDDSDLIAECRGRGGAVQFAARAADLRWRALVF